jgi:hypothetical protein
MMAGVALVMVMSLLANLAIEDGRFVHSFLLTLRSLHAYWGHSSAFMQPTYAIYIQSFWLL